MPQPAGILIANQSESGVIQRPNKAHAIKAGDPSWDGRFLFQPGNIRVAAHVEKMHHRPAPLLHEAAERLHVIVMNTAAPDAKPFAFAELHEMESDMRVLELFARSNQFQIGASKDKAIRAQ